MLSGCTQIHAGSHIIPRRLSCDLKISNSSCVDAKKHVYKRDGSVTYRRKDAPFAIKACGIDLNVQSPVLTFFIQYGTGESHGTTGTDKMWLGDLEIDGQSFGQCDQPDDVMKVSPASCVRQTLIYPFIPGISI